MRRLAAPLAWLRAHAANLRVYLAALLIVVSFAAAVGAIAFAVQANRGVLCTITARDRATLRHSPRNLRATLELLGVQEPALSRLVARNRVASERELARRPLPAGCDELPDDPDGSAP